MILNIKGNRFNNKDFPLLLGILNITPDSFSDGGKYNSEYKALKKVENYLNEDVDIIDIEGKDVEKKWKEDSNDENGMAEWGWRSRKSLVIDPDVEDEVYFM